MWIKLNGFYYNRSMISYVGPDQNDPLYILLGVGNTSERVGPFASTSARDAGINQVLNTETVITLP